MTRNHVIITGTGRAGTSFLVQLLTHLGLDTGFTPETLRLDDIAHAGLEIRKLPADAPYIVKSPWYCGAMAFLCRLFNHHQACGDSVRASMRPWDAGTRGELRTV